MNALKNRINKHLGTKQHPAKRGRPTAQSTATNPSPSRAPDSKLRWLLLAVCLVVSGAGTYFALSNYVWSPIPSSMVGTWVVQDGPMGGAKLEFARNGDFKAHVTIDGKDGVVEARVRLDGDMLRFISVNPYTRVEETKSQKVSSVTENELIIVDEKGTPSRLARSK